MRKIILPIIALTTILSAEWTKPREIYKDVNFEDKPNKKIILITFQNSDDSISEYRVDREEFEKLVIKHNKTDIKGCTK